MLPRIIARLDVKAPYLVKPVNLEGVRKVGIPGDFARDYYEQGIDEIIYMDVVASLYEYNSLTDLVRETARNVFVPLTVGGGLRSVKDVEFMLQSGADKVAVNTAAIRNPDLINQVVNAFGSQCLVLSIEAKRRPGGRGWEAYVDCGRQKTGYDVLEWISEGVDRGAGEILLTSVDHEGLCRGFDIELGRKTSEICSVPLILSGGMGEGPHMVDAFTKGKVDAIAMAHVLHYKKFTVGELREILEDHGIPTRRV